MVRREEEVALLTGWRQQIKEKQQALEEEIQGLEHPEHPDLEDQEPEEEFLEAQLDAQRGDHREERHEGRQ